jgi:pilus assembly protein CpaB
MLRVLILLIALGAGSLAGWLALSNQSDAPAANVVPPPQELMEDVLVASLELGQGQKLGDANVRWQRWPKAAISPGFISRDAKPDAMATLKDAVVRSPFLSGEPIREDKLTRGSSGLLATTLPSGKRAVAIRVNAESTAGGFILPYDRVDVIQTIGGQAAGGSGILSRTLLSNIRVLAVDQATNEPKDQIVAIGKTVTLELSPTQTEAIITAQAVGSLSLALRSLTDSAEASKEHSETKRSVQILRGGRSEILSVQ